MKEDILVSVCMITYNHAKFIRQAVESVLCQELVGEFELIISDDYSTDNTKEIIESIIDQNPNGGKIKYYQHESNLGMSNNFIWTLKKCKGKYIAYCEGDDFWTDSFKLLKQVTLLEENRSVSFSFHRTKILNDSTGVLTSDKNEKFFNGNPNELIISGYTFSEGWQIGMQTLVFRSALISDLDFHSFNYFRDVHLLAHLVLKSNGVCQNFHGSVYRIHENGVYSGIGQKEKLKIGYLIYNELFNYYNEEFLKIILINYLHDLINYSLSHRDYLSFIFHLKKIILFTSNFKILGHYLKKFCSRLIVQIN